MDSDNNNFEEDDEYYYLPKAFMQPPLEMPKGDALLTDTSYPQISSAAFRHATYNNIERENGFLPFYTLLELSSDGLFVIGTNDFNSSITEGNFIGTDNFESIVRSDMQNTLFRLPKYDTVTALKFLESNTFMTAQKNCTLEMLAPKHSLNDKHKDSVYRISTNTTDGFVQHIDKVSGETKVIVGTTKGSISIFDYGGTETICITDLPYAHSTITGLSVHPSSPKMWASCASKSCLLWDKTLEKPASGILTNHPDQLTSLYWTSEEENKENIVLGDESGNVLTIDPRIPNKILNTTCVSNRSISQIKFNGSNLFGVVSSNTVKIIKANAGSEELKMVHQYVSPQVQYAMCWDKKEKKTFFAVGENKSAVEVKML